ncbi:polymorphic toxin-type HINT domain-containing protein [Streptomyces uncialis]|uniref:polymorphic toxin-type HINT domain-containing protein n=1 Tax=Streptomyces uncialis TaxID=1048205 RepID=UPI0022543BC9|nr:polymorphic toxin-type HINT domain-containing protein [Streptomyces uncialis]
MRSGGTPRPADAAARTWRAPKVTWPEPGSTTVAVAATAGAAARRAGALPVSVSRVHDARKPSATAPGKVKVTVTDRRTARAAGVDGILLAVSRPGARTTADVGVRVDYTGFRGAYGGDWAARLRLVRLPACALTTPKRPACRTGVPLTTTHDAESRTLGTTVTIPRATVKERSASGTGSTAVLALSAGDSGPTGTYRATPLQTSGSWEVGGPAGGFAWQHPIVAPAVPGGLQPDISLGYSSQAVDGRTGATNSQPSWIGDGWGYEPGFIERRYTPCEDDRTGGTNTTKVGDLCWFNDNATLSLGGKNTELVYDAEKGWRPVTDSGERIEKLTTGTVNGDNDNEHWKITTTDGMRYYFGRNRLPGWSDNGDQPDDPVTNSTWTVPVFGNHSSEPCHGASFANAWCQQAWRWQLDHVVDPRGNAMAYYWDKETNNYGRNVSLTTGKATVTPYTRGGHLDRIEYGLRANSVHAKKAMGRVDFTVGERCLTNCATFDEPNAKNWPDVPYDQYCGEGSTECKSQYSPSFWSRKRLTGITTRILTGGVYKGVDSWALEQNFPPSGDGISTPMWLSSITRTGTAGGTVTLPPVRFTGVQKPNRVDRRGDGLAPYIRLRMSQIINESGGSIAVDYLDPSCTPTSPPPPDGTNTTLCYPVKWAYEGDTAKLDWFTTYPARRVVEGDNLATTPDTVTEYTYVGGAAWAKSDDEFTKAEDRTHSVPRGHYLVQTRTGTGTDPRTLSETRYFRGIDGAEVKNGAGVVVTDREQFAGAPREQATYNGDGGALISATSYTPWRSAVNATRARTGLPALEARYTGTEAEETRTTVTGGIRTTKTTHAHDSHGMVTEVSDHGDTAKTGDEKCTTTSYARNTHPDVWILTAVSRVETVAVTCDKPVTRPADVIDDVRTHYDGGAFGAAPTKALVTRSERIKGDGSGYDPLMTVPATCGTGGAQLCYDAYGRTLKAADPYGKVTSTTHSPAADEPPTSTAVTNPLNHRTSTITDPLRGQPTQVTDANGKVTTTGYDALGRVTRVWTPTRSAATFPNAPSHSFDYLVRNDAPTVVTSKSLDHNSVHQTTYALYDGLLRPRQTQVRSPDRAGRLVTETSYNTRGETWHDSGVYFATGAPEPTLVTGQESRYPASAETVFDGAGRPTAVISKKFGDETKRVTTAYTGDTTTVTPPAGGTTTTTVVDALGRTTQVKQHLSGPSTTQSTTYGYNRHGRLHTVTDPSGARWTYTHNTRGLVTGSDDPDRGTTTTSYDHGDRPVTTTDARGVSLTTTYDELGRRTALKKGATTLSEWTYDTAAKGRPAKAVRHVDGKTYTNEITTYGDLYQPATTKVSIPAAHGLPAATYEWTNHFSPNTGQPEGTDHPALGGLPAESVTTAYNTSGLVDSVYAGGDPLISAATYDHYGRTARLEHGAFGRHLFTTRQFDDHTGLVVRAVTDRETAPQRVEDTRYTYDPAGNVTRIATAYGQDAQRTTDTQCFSLDTLRRVTEAWTNTGETCAASPSAGVIGGEDPYWTSYTYDPVGNRRTEVQHQTTGGPAADLTRTYTAPDTGRHNLPKVTQTGPGAHEETYTYDATGNTLTRKLGTADVQNLVWDDQGHLKTVTQGAKSSEYLYGADGERLIREDSTGTTLYLPGGNELHVDKVGLTTGTRHYTAGGQSIAVRTGTNLTFTLTDHHNTTTTQVTTDTTQAITRRKTTLFGAPRGLQPTTWTGDKGFVGGTRDTDTGLTHLGAREYDPAVGRFISVDPIMDLADSQQIHGYTYANNNPVTYSDPTGLLFGPGFFKAVKKVYQWAQKAVKRYARGRGIGTPSTQIHSGGEEQRVIHGIAVPSLKELKRLPFAVGDKSHEELLTRWAEWKCSSESESTEKFCAAGQTEFNMYKKGLFDRFVESVVVPDIDAWKNCPNSISSCMEAALDLPIFKPAKGVKSLKALRDCNSFTPGTRVLMADGATKPIEDVRVGDKVLAANPKTGKVAAHTVTAELFGNSVRDLVRITIDPDGKKGGPSASLEATDEHPFWVPQLDEWVNATDLRPGQWLRTSSGTRVEITAVKRWTERTSTHNLTVDDLHTYYVLAGATPVLVHNSNCDLPEGYTSSPALKGDPYHPDSVAARSKQNGELYAGTVGDRAGALGYRTRIPAQKAPFNSHGQVVFSNGKNYITPDVDGHNVSDGWKMFNRKGQRIGTYDPDLNYLKE